MMSNKLSLSPPHDSPDMLRPQFQHHLCWQTVLFPLHLSDSSQQGHTADTEQTQSRLAPGHGARRGFTSVAVPLETTASVFVLLVWRVKEAGEKWFTEEFVRANGPDRKDTRSAERRATEKVMNIPRMWGSVIVKHIWLKLRTYIMVFIIMCYIFLVLVQGQQYWWFKHS